MYFETSAFFADEVMKYALQHKFVNVELQQDLSGRDRMIKAQWIVFS